MRADKNLSRGDLWILEGVNCPGPASVEHVLALLEEKGLAGFLEARPHYGRMTLYQAVLKRCRALRYEDPQQMIHFAALAVQMASRFSVERYGQQRIADYQFQALIELANSYRVADCLDQAGDALGEAASYFSKGSQDELLKARQFDVQASLFAARRNFAAAASALDTVHAIHKRKGHGHLAGRALISKGIYLGYAGQPEEALRLLREGISQVDRDQDPALAMAGVQCQAHFLMVLGRYREARKLIWSHHFTPQVIGGRINQLKFRWLQAQIQLGLGDIERAEAGLIEAREGFLEARLHYKAALASLELAQLWIRKGKRREVQEMVGALVQVFQAYQIHREAFAGLMLLEAAFAEDIKDVGAILDAVTDFVKRAETDPRVIFQDWFSI